jgi:acetolactate synthase I/II/III large subunit
VRALIREADAILALNLRFGEMTTDGYGSCGCRSAGPDADPRPCLGPGTRQGLCADLPIHASHERGRGAADGVSGSWGDWRAKARQARASRRRSEAPEQPSPVDMARGDRASARVLPEDAIVTNGAGNFAVWPNKFSRSARARGCSRRNRAPWATGCRRRSRRRSPASEPHGGVTFAGDGDFQMNCQELATAKQAGAQPIVLIVNNGIYGTIRAHQERHYPGRVSGPTW